MPDQQFVKREDLIDALRELGVTIAKGDPDAAKERDEKKARLLQAKNEFGATMVRAEHEKNTLQTQCTHQKENGEHATGGQALSNGNVLIICQRCFKEWQIKPSEANLRMIERGDLSLSGIRPPQEEPIGAEVLAR